MVGVVLGEAVVLEEVSGVNWEGRFPTIAKLACIMRHCKHN